MKRALRIAAAGIVLLAAFVYLNNTTWLVSERPNRPTLLAHRGLAQTYDPAGLERDTCTATRIHPPEHPFLENTLPSMHAAFAAGADVVEFDVHPTTDGHFAVFHDWTVDCRTEGRGVTRGHTLAQLKALDVGYGYTADGGKTYPFRGRGVGMMPSLDEVLDTFPTRRFLIHIKSNDPDEGERLAERLRQLPAQRRARLMVYGGDAPIAVMRRELPEIPAMSRATLKQCLLRYLVIGWTGAVPTACRNSLLLVPANYAAWLWSWPDGFINRMKRVSTEVFVIGRYDGADFSSSIDTANDLNMLPKPFRTGIWTNRIDRIAPLVRAKP
ncbi:MAG: glycerophosphodiester phosphodiesterase [Rhizobiales bacterium]|nr:glycerophosphodiester phosphodiesterase [Hyphomicrobiales bacterium]